MTDLDPLASRYRLSRRVISWIIVISMFALYLKPLGLPLTIEEYTLNMYNHIETLGPESKPYIVSLDYSIGGKGEVYPAVLAVTKHLLSREVPLVFLGFAMPEVTPMMDQLFKDVQIEEKWGYEYGVDYVGIGYIPGTETAGAALATNFKNVVQADAYGNSLNDLEISKDFTDWQDFSGVFAPTTVTGGGWITYWNVPYGFPVTQAVLGSMAMQGVEQVDLGYLVGFIAGIRGGAEYEKLTGFLGKGAKSLDVLSTVHILGIAFIVAGNIEWYYKRRQENGS
jgi:hypothetical protein